MIKKDIIPFHQIYDSVIKKNNIFSNISIYLKNNYFLKIKNLYSTIYIIEGKERYCKEPLSLLFYGDSQSVNYISQMFFKEKPEVEIIAICPFWKVNRIVMNLSRKVDLNIIKTYDFILEYFKKRGFFIIPAWVSLKIDVSRPFSEITKKFNKSAKRDVKKIKENGYTYEITTDIEKFKKFYYEIRKPYFSKRIGKKALYGSDKYNEIKIAFQNGKLFLIKKGNEYASGFVILTSDNGVSPHFRGTVQEGHMDQGAGSALNYFLIRWANEQGYKIINFGHTRTFLNDGILRFKRKWGMTINIDKFFTDIFGIKINNYSKKAVIDLIENNPFLYIDEGKLKGFVFSKKHIHENERKKILKKYYFDGMNELDIICTVEKLEKVLNYKSKSNKEIIRLTKDNFS